MIKQFRAHYPLALKRRVVLEFIEKNKRSPSREQIFELMQEGAKKYPHLNKLGFSQFDTVVPHFGEESSVADFNKNRQAHRDDAVVIGNKLDELVDVLEDSYRSFKCTLDRCKKLNSSIEARLNNLLLLSGRTDVFVHGVEESFDTSEFIDLEKSTVQVNPGYVTLGRDKFIAEDLEGALITVSCVTPGGKLGTVTRSSPYNLLKDDGLDWAYYVLTSYKVGQVSAIIELDFNTESGRPVGDIRLTGNPTDTNSKTSVSIYYSLNGSDYILHQPSGIGFSKGENLFSLGLDGIKKIKVLLTKTASDIQESPNTFLYMFGLDSIEVISGNYTSLTSSEMYAGPYHIVNDSGEPVNFTLATLSHGTCCLTPSKTSVSFYLSKDGQSWYPASYDEEGIDIVHFASTHPSEESLIDVNALSTNSLIADPDKLVDLDVNINVAGEAVCNVYIPEKYAKDFVLQNTYVKRNLKQLDKQLYGLQTGWFNDLSELKYRTTLWVDSFEGVVINLGSTSAFIDGKLVTGEVMLPRGYHDFSTNYTNWLNVEPGLPTVEKLKENDPLYPRNHKLMIEGYAYPTGFEGEKVYNGIGTENFGALLKYVSPEQFIDKEYDKNLYIYTVEEYNGNLFFKVKKDPSDASWVEEEIEVNYMLRLDNTNTIYVRAILKTQDTKKTPNINRFQVRVI